tara:strand:- start:1624 stop:2034 length:411 start_codon:yes stop_codon:yes gene_type:complete
MGDNEKEAYDIAVSQYNGVLEALKSLYDERDRTLAVIWSYMEATGAKYLRTPEFEVTIPTKRQYDYGLFVQHMGEEASEALIPEHEETKLIKAKVDGTKAKKLWGMGDEMVAKLEQTLIPQKPEVKLKAIKKEQGL